MRLLLVVVAIAAATLLPHPDPLLVPPGTTPGLVELAAVTLARILPSAPLGEWLSIGSRVALAAMAAGFALLSYSLTRQIAVALAVAITVALVPSLAPALTPLEPLAPALAAATLLAALAHARSASSQHRRWALVGLVANAAISPPLAAPLTIVALWFLQTNQAASAGSTSASRYRATSVLPLLAAAGITLVMPALPPSVDVSAPSWPLWIWPSLRPGEIAHALAAARTLLLQAGPYSLGLAALGLFASWRAIRDARTWPLIGYAVLPILWAGARSDGTLDATAVRVLAPTLACFWALAALGLAELLGFRRRNVGGLVAGAALVLLLPSLQLMRVPPVPLPAQQPMGHERLTLARTRGLIDILPAGTVIVSEDAVTDLLLRAVDGFWQRRGKDLRLISRSSSQLPTLARSTSAFVLAFPSAQADLQNIGFVLSNDTLTTWPGAARVVAGGTCRVVTRQWGDASDLAAGGNFALVGHDDDAVGPIVMYAGADAPFAPRTLEWPGPATRGFVWGLYDLSSPAEVQRLAHEMEKDHLTPGGAVSNAHYAIRLEMWRTPTAPAVLPASLGPSIRAAAVRLRIGSSAQHLDLCAAFPYTREAMR